MAKTSPIRALTGAALVLVLASCIVETKSSESVRTKNDGFGFDIGVVEVERILELTIPAGALDRLYRSELGLSGTVTLDPPMKIEFEIGSPMDQTVVVEKGGALDGTGLQWEPSGDCINGCTLQIPVTIRKLDGDWDSFVSWAVLFSIWTDGPPDGAAANMEMRLLNGDGAELEGQAIEVGVGWTSTSRWRTKPETALRIGIPTSTPEPSDVDLIGTPIDHVAAFGFDYNSDTLIPVQVTNSGSYTIEATDE